MSDLIQTVPARSRLMRSARVLKSYFEHKLQLKLELLIQPPNELVIEGMQFDLKLSSWGIWGLSSSAPLTEKMQGEISSTFHGLLGAMDNLDARNHDLLRLQEKFEATLEDFPSNVIPIRRAFKTSFKTQVRAPEKRWILRLDCLLESTEGSEIQKMALELHSQSHRYAFMEYENLDLITRLDCHQLLQLGSISLFIPNILQITAAEQEVLLQLLKYPAVDRPLLMVGATTPYSNLRTEPKINLELLVLLSRAYIKLSRPFSEYKDQGLIHYFLDSLAQNPS